MKLRRTITATTAALALTFGLGIGLSPGAQAAAPAVAPATAHPGTRSLAEVLAADGSRFDRRWGDFDIVDAAVRAVLAAKPTSPVAVLADGTVPLTAFLPTDEAFRVLAHDLTHRWYRSEQQVFGVVASLGIDTVEQVLLYHVVPGTTITARAALASDGASLTTAQGGSITVDVLFRPLGIAQLVDKDPDAPNPFLIPWKLDLNTGNLQVAHGISRVLRPVDL
ncbi:fasciclin domain-containing protein [Cellulomonas sp. HZM]|uniref:fasciclin domain-containing protein n=1 Tax=Cellulomonas sp. HZM TaxID=1454010 RepID=UPI0004937CAB|nr:fasciclin domain-containing protein [Cellulomonas sp. HZM]